MLGIRVCVYLCELIYHEYPYADFPMLMSMLTAKMMTWNVCQQFEVNGGRVEYRKAVAVIRS